MKTSIGMKLFLGFGALLLLMVVVIAFNLIGLQNLKKDQDIGAKRAEAGSSVSVTMRLGEVVYRIVADAVINRNIEDTKKNWAEQKKNSDQELKVIESIIDTEQEKGWFKEVMVDYDNFINYFETNMLPKLEKTKEVSEDIRKDDAQLDIYLSAFIKPLQLIKESLKKEQDQADKDFDTTSASILYISIILGIFSIILGTILAFLLSRSITKPMIKISDTLGNGAGQIALASNQLSSSSQEIANGATEQASSIEETTSSMEELASMVKQNVQNAKEASSLADKTAGTSQSGFVQMEKMLESMNEINKASSQIQKVIKVIDDIAFQTNILALNAAVEAARAGEAGMGFAVVADEVKNLANKSAEAAKETASMIEDSIKKTGGGLEIATKLAEVFKEILTNAQKVSEMAKEVETASRQQDAGINQVNKAIVNFDEVVQSNASSAEETASSAEELLAQVETLNSIVSQLVLIVTGKEKIIEQQKNDQIEYTTKKKILTQTFEKKQLNHPKDLKKMEIDSEKIIPFEEDEEFK